MPVPTSFFALPDRLAVKRDEQLIARDEQQFAAIADALAAEAAALTDRLAERRRSAAGPMAQALERDQEIHRIETRLRTLGRFGVDLCLGRMVPSDGGDPVYIGRVGLTDRAGVRLLADWRSGLAAPFFAATSAEPMGLASRRRYRWSGRCITDYWDEAIDASAGTSGGAAALDGQSAFIASLGGSRSARMRDVLGTIQADQDAVIRADSAGTLVVDGGPGTGKTVAALHRAAYLLYSDPRVGSHHGGVLFVGPNAAYLDFVADVLPNLGEDGVRMATLRDLDPRGAEAVPEPDDRVLRLKGDARTSTMIERAVREYERVPTHDLVVETDWADVVLTPEDWANAFEALEPGTSHDDARGVVWDALTAIVAVRAGAEAESTELRAELGRHEALRTVFDRSWPLLNPEGVVADLWTSADHLRRCAPWLSEDDVRLLVRRNPRAWTLADLPILDAARARIGDPAAGARARDRARAAAQERTRMDRVVDELVESQDRDDLMLMSMLRGQDLRNALADQSAHPEDTVDPFANAFAHVVVDEAQELTDAEWAMLLRRCPSRSITVVGDRAQARHGFTESWTDRLRRIGLRNVHTVPLHVNYRTPSEIMAVAEPEIRAALPDANVPESIRSGGALSVAHVNSNELEVVLLNWLGSRDDGTAAVITAHPDALTIPDDGRVRAMTAAAAKGLEFDLVVLVNPDEFGTGINGAVDRYVAMTRATEQLVILTPGPVTE